MRDINLLEGLGGRKKFDAKKSLRGAIILVVIVAVLLGGAAFGLRYLNGQFRQELDGINAQIIQYKDIGDVKKAITDKRQLIDSLKELLETADTTSRVDSAFFETVSGALSKSVYLTSLALNEDGTVSLAGKGLSREDITYFIYSLKLTGAFRDITFSVISQEKNETTDTELFGFAATAVLVSEEVPSGE
jgi:Tfp pilus assembly protein PilN